MTTFTNLSNVSGKTKSTEFEHYLDLKHGQITPAYSSPVNFKSVDYLGRDFSGKDIFRVYDQSDKMYIYTGVKGEEF